MQKKFCRIKLRGKYTLIMIKLTERSDIHKYSIVNFQSSIPVHPGKEIQP
jgi:hypothetical protein